MKESNLHASNFESKWLLNVLRTCILHLLGANASRHPPTLVFLSLVDVGCHSFRLSQAAHFVPKTLGRTMSYGERENFVLK
jgi:hypothetical protein